jgi:hypothetical protein
MLRLSLLLLAASASAVCAQEANQLLPIDTTFYNSTTFALATRIDKNKKVSSCVVAVNFEHLIQPDSSSCRADIVANGNWPAGLMQATPSQHSAPTPTSTILWHVDPDTARVSVCVADWAPNREHHKWDCAELPER